MHQLRYKRKSYCSFKKKLGLFLLNCLQWMSLAKQVQKYNIIKGCAFYFCSRLLLTGAQKRFFEKLSIYCDRYAEQIPVTFVLGKYRSHAACSHTAVSTTVTPVTLHGSVSKLRGMPEKSLLAVEPESSIRFTFKTAFAKLTPNKFEVMTCTWTIKLSLH